jgi:hypothetical protein
MVTGNFKNRLARLARYAADVVEKQKAMTRTATPA